MSPHHRIRARDEGLRRTASLTAWVCAGSAVLTGGFSVLAAHSFSGASSAAAASPDVVTDDTESIDPAADVADTSDTVADSGTDDAAVPDSQAADVPATESAVTNPAAAQNFDDPQLK